MPSIAATRRWFRQNRAYRAAYMRWYRALGTTKPLPKPTPNQAVHVSP